MFKIILGTANLGMAYGVANKGLVLAESDSKEIITKAQLSGINRFDTASAYLGAETILGKYLDKNLMPSVDAKIGAEDCKSVESMIEATVSILSRLKIPRLSILYLHNADLLVGEQKNTVMEGLQEILRLGFAERIGVSVYTESSVISSKNIFPQLTAFQVPENICDRRLVNSKAISFLAKQDCVFIVRSIFLQGLLHMDPINLPDNLKSARNVLLGIRKFSNSNSISITDLCIAYAKSISWANGIIVGVASPLQLIEISRSQMELPLNWLSSISTLPEDILDPRLWNL